MNMKHTSLKTEAESFDLHTGLSNEYREKISEVLSDVLASVFSLMIKSQITHWNVVGPLFMSVHELTEEHYNDLFAATDVIAERIRALGNLTPMHSDLVNMINEDVAGNSKPTPQAMIEDLIATHEKIVRTIRTATETAGEAGDVVTEDMFTERLNFHEKAIWMLRSTIAN